MADDPQSMVAESTSSATAVAESVAVSPTAARPAIYPPRMTNTAVLGWLIALIAVMLAAALLRYEAPSTVRLPWIGTAIPESCGAKRNFGVECPGCGLTRSFILSADGRWAEAFQMHPPGTLAFGFLALLIPLRVWQGYRIRVGNPPRSTIVTELILLASLMGLSVVWWVAKHGLALLHEAG